MNLVSAHEIATMLGVSRQRVDQLTRHTDFPKPVAVLKVGRIWKAADIEKWAKAHGRTISPPTPEA